MGTLARGGAPLRPAFLFDEDNARKVRGEQGISENEAFEKGVKEKLTEFVKNGAKVYAKRVDLIGLQDTYRNTAAVAATCPSE